jgi:phage baseplate assembly protein W
MAESNSRAFKDIDLTFKAHPVTGDLPILKNEKAIKRAVRNLVQTIVGERPFASNIGTDVTRSLFDFVDYGSAGVISQQIIDVLSGFEGRIANTKVQVNPSPDDNSFDIRIAYDIVGESFDSQEFEFILESTR